MKVIFDVRAGSKYDDDFTTMAKSAAPSYVTRVLRLTLLSPEIVESILGGRQPEEVTLARMLQQFPVEWEARDPALRLTVRSGRWLQVRRPTAMQTKLPFKSGAEGSTDGADSPAQSGKELASC